MLTLTEIIFEGNAGKIKFETVFKLWNIDLSRITFNSTDTIPKTEAQLLHLIRSSDYLDFVIGLNDLKTDDITIPNLFIDVGINRGQVELLLFFDLKDFKEKSFLNLIDRLRVWSVEFQKKCFFDTVLCRIDEGNDKQFYFDETSTGPMYNLLKDTQNI